MSSYNVVDLRCPGCGEPSSVNTKKCKYCGRDILISSFTSVYEMTSQDADKYVKSYKEVLQANPNDAQINTSIAMCYLKLKNYDKAIASFEKAMEDDFDNSETYFYAAVCLLKGKKAFLAPLAEVKKAEMYINSSLKIENRGIYYYYLAYLKYDFYERKHLNTSPTFREAISLAKGNNVTDYEIQTLFELLDVARPDNIDICYSPQ
jgi:tetratricopeptide (TPR) repeat protein